MPGRGRVLIPFEPTEEQREVVVTLVGFGLRHQEIAKAIYFNGKPISERTLEKKFKTELTSAHVQLKADLGKLLVATISGRAPPQGMKGITNEAARAKLFELWLKNQAGWSDRVAHEGGNKPIPVTYQPFRGEQGL